MKGGNQERLGHIKKADSRANLMMCVTIAWSLFLCALALILWLQPEWAFHIIG